MINLYSPAKTISEAFLDVGDGHEIYCVQSGNPNGAPVLVFHAGPGGSSKEKYRSYFDPDYFRIIQFDQRGCGKSRYNDRFAVNTTWHSVHDAHKVLSHFGVQKAFVMGISWGGTLATLFAILYPQMVKSVLCRGLITTEGMAYARSFQSRLFYPHQYSRLKKNLGAEHEDLFYSVYHHLFDSDFEVRRKAAYEWALWERCFEAIIPTITFTEDQIGAQDIEDCQMEMYYFKHDLFFRDFNFYKEAEKIESPYVLVNGRFDVYTLPDVAYRLAQSVKHGKFVLCEASAHNTAEPRILNEVMDVVESWKE